MNPLHALIAIALLAPLHAADIIQAGKPLAEIVIAETPARMTKLASRELQTYLERVSGAKLEIVTQPSPGKMHIFLGESAHTDALKLSTEALENGAFRMASGKDWLALLGPDEDFVPVEPWGRFRGSAEAQRVNQAFDKISGDTFWNHCANLYTRYHKDLDVWDYDDTGTLNATYEFLRSLGVRWFAPGELGEIVPKQATIALPSVNKTVKPDFALRRISYYTEHLGLGELGIWDLRLGLNFGHKLIGVTQPGHGIKFVLWREEMKKAHPEMYLIQKGAPNLTHKGTGAPCLNSPLLYEKQLKYARAMFDHFKEPMLSIDLVDGYGGMVCEHPACQAQMTPGRGWPGSMSDYAWGYLNRVATELNKSHPGQMVSGLAYSAYKLPPEKIEMMSPNLAIIECRGRSRMYDEQVRNDSRATREAWLKKLPSKKLFTWDYYLSAVPEDVGQPAFFPHLIASDLRELKGVSMGDSIEVYQHQPGTEASFGYDPLAVEHLNLYITSRLWWDASQDVDALLNDYYQAYYGPAAKAMKAFIEYCESNWMHMRADGARIGQAFTLLDAARAAVEPSTAYGQRIANIATLMKPMHTLQQQLSRKRETDLAYRVLETWQAGGKPMKDKKLDGQLPKEFWPDVRVVSLTPLLPGTRAKVNGELRVLREGNILYFGIRCDEPEMKGQTLPTTASGDAKLFEGDFVSIMLETPARSYYEIAFNPAGAVVEIDRGEGGSAKWLSGAQVAVHRGEGYWSAEVRIPIAGEGARLLDPLKGIDGAQPKELFPWYFNVCRQRVRGMEIERTAYSATGNKEEFRLTPKFAKLWGK